VRRAAALLEALESRAGDLTDAGALPLFAAAQPAAAPPAESPVPDPLQAALEALDPDRLTPREALEALYRLRTMLPSAARPVIPPADPIT
jgi:DNA mismatch repair protein MutS